MTIIFRGVCCLVVFLLIRPAMTLGQNEEAEIVSISITDSLYMLQGEGGNVGLSIGKDWVVLIDDKYAELTDEIFAAVREITDLPIQFVINTHWHHDHSGGNENLSNAHAIIAAHENARRRMIVEQIIVPPMTGDRAPALPEGGWPVITFADEMTFHLGNREVHAVHVERAHTDGDAIIHFVADDAIHMGDVLFSRQYPNIDVGSGGTIDGMIAAQEFALSLAGPNTRFIPGHGDLASRHDLQATIRMLRTVRDRVATLAGEGLTQDEIVARKPLNDLDVEWGQGYIKADRMVIQAYKSIDVATRSGLGD